MVLVEMEEQRHAECPMFNVHLQGEAHPLESNEDPKAHGGAVVVEHGHRKGDQSSIGQHGRNGQHQENALPEKYKGE